MKILIKYDATKKLKNNDDLKTIRAATFSDRNEEQRY